MNFDFSDDLKALRDQAARVLADLDARGTARRVMDSGEAFDRDLWRTVAELGWTGIAVPEEFGGSDIGYQGLCLLAEELGRSLAPIPFSSSVYLATEALLAAGTAEQKRHWLPGLCDGDTIGAFALMEGVGNPSPATIAATASGGRLRGRKVAVADGAIADLAIVVARVEGGEIGLVAVDLDQTGVVRAPMNTIDPTRGHAVLEFDGAACEPLAGGDSGWDCVMRLLARAAVLVAFEQIGGAQACLHMARTHAVDRYAFGRPIGSFQAIKHKLAHIFIAIELARSNAFYGAWAAAQAEQDIVIKAAAAARYSASKAFQHAAKENIQTHGGMGYTWESDCHLFYRRAKLLALSLGSVPFWSDQLMARLAASNQTAEVRHGL